VSTVGAADPRRHLVLFALRVVILAAFAVYLIALYRGTPWLSDPTTVGTDASNYYAAAQRLNDGHPLYHLSTGDLEVPMGPPYANIPLVSPPPIAVAWRPIQLLPRDVAIYAWWAAMVAAIVVTVVWLTGLGSLTLTLGTGLLITELAITGLSANINAVLIGLVCLVWLAYRANRAPMVGILVAAAVALKVMPIVLVVWLVAGRRWSDLRWFVGAGLAIGFMSLAGAGLANHLDWLSVARSTGTEGLAPWSLPGMLGRVGLSPGLLPLVMPATLLAGSALILVLRDWPGAGFAVALVTMVLANPAIHDGSFALLLPALMPLARPMRDAGPAARADAAAVGSTQAEAAAMPNGD
jgi:hypothetical protein